jgi:hypothetical protein
MNPKDLLRVVVFSLFVFGFSSNLIAQFAPRSFAEPHVLRAVRQLHSAQATYQAVVGNGNFGSLAELRQAGLIDEALASGNKYGYVFVVSTMIGPPRFAVTATPRAYRKSGVRSFYIDQAGEVHGGDKNGQPAMQTDPIIDDCTNGSVQDNERCTIGDMRLLHAAQMTYAATAGNGNFALLPRLYLAGLIRSDLYDYAARGYVYQVQVIDFVPDAQPASFKIWATPAAYPTSAVRSFYIDTTGVLRGADKNGGMANQNDPPINE